jgi:hypothetical protein
MGEYPESLPCICLKYERQVTIKINPNPIRPRRLPTRPTRAPEAGHPKKCERRLKKHPNVHSISPDPDVVAQSGGDLAFYSLFLGLPDDGDTGVWVTMGLDATLSY